MLLFLLFSCKKEDEFLSAKPNQSLVIPATLDDYENLLNNNRIFNQYTDPSLGHVSSDEYYVTDALFNVANTNTERNAYIWAKDIYQGETFGDSDWDVPYQQVYYSNVILEGISKITPTTAQQVQFNRIKGSALFFRAWAFNALVQNYAMPYDPVTSATDLGIPLRLTSDLNVKSTRPTVKETYERVVSDLKLATQLLPENSNQKTLPSGIAVLGLLSRVYLTMGDFTNAYDAANKYLQKNSVLTNYNTLTPRTFAIHTTFLSEDIFHTSFQTSYAMAGRSKALIDPSFVASYDNNDLRKTLMFKLASGVYHFVGSYDYRGFPYSGIATDEMYLNRAECSARAGNTDAAMADLNNLLKTRWKTGSVFTPYQAANADIALKQILAERKKELFFRSIRWTDIRRLNKEKEFAVTLSRTINGKTYILPPNDKRFALPIPNSEIQLSGLQQNER
ncbi:SusD family protein [Mucilaginibacter pineti]|uniref:SusD family protein n=2 Tax=Mucilaginibacter pineti TaxID=1391627 RepID=A0A1G7GHE1_9SPHI|nr:SusD family protein [Mucilaginibacter pineti]